MKINWLFFRRLLLLFCVLSALWTNAQEEPSGHDLRVAESIGPGIPVSLEVLLRYNPDLYEGYRLKITFPDKLYQNNLNVTGGTQDVLLFNRIHDNNNRSVTFDIEFLVSSDKDWPEINIPIQGFLRPNNSGSCEPYYGSIVYEISATEIKDNAPASFSAQTSVTLNGTGGNTIQPSINPLSFNQGSETLPVFYDITLNNIHIINTLQTTISFDSEELEFITAVNMIGNSNNTTHGMQHAGVIATTTTGGLVSFSFEVNGLPAYTFRVYFKPKVMTISEPIEVDVREVAEGRPIEETIDCIHYKREATRTDNANRTIGYLLENISYQPNLTTPYFPSTTLLCPEVCSASSSTYVIFEVNGHYTTVNTTRNLEIKPHSSAKVSSLQFYEHFFGQLDNIQLEYKVCGAEESVNTTLTGQTFAFESGGVYLEYLYIKNIPIDAGTARDIRLNYSHTTTASSCGGVNIFYYGFAGPDLSYRSMNSPSCNQSKRIWDAYYTLSSSSSIAAKSVFEAEEDALVQIRLEITSTTLPGTYVFEDIAYTLSDKMYFTGEPLLFSYNATYSNFKSAGDFMNGNSDVLALTARIDPENNEKMLIEHIAIDKSCSNGINNLYILARVRTKAKIPETDQGYRSTVQKNDNQLSLSTLTLWNTVVGSFNFSVDAKLSCSQTLLRSDSDVRPGDLLTLYYIMGNSGSAKLKNLRYQVGTLQFGELGIAPESTGVLYQVDENNAFEELNASYPIHLNTETEITNELLGYHQFIVAARYKIPTDPAFLDKTFTVNLSSYGYSKQNIQTSTHAASISLTVRKEAPLICVPVSCSECVTSFSPLPGEEYQLSAWIKEDYKDKVPATYRHSGVRIIFDDEPATAVIYRPSGPIIDGWQRVDTTFAIPLGAASISIGLVNEKTIGDAYFDDIRIHPFRSNMKSFVYDPSTRRLVAELDENNYATRYEYDDEGILIRVKKETERGVMTIKETRTNQSKIHTD